MTDEELRRLAEAARNPLVQGDVWEFEAAANPAAIIALLDRLRAAEAENARLRWALQDIEQIGGANKLYTPSAIARYALKEPTP